MSKTAKPSVETTVAMTSAPTRFSTMPARAISAIDRRLLPNTTAFGRVATGSMKAHEAESVAGIVNANGCVPDRRHHHRCRSVRNPHGEERRRGHETQHDARRPAAGQTDNVQRDAPVQPHFCMASAIVKPPRNITITLLK